MNNLDRLIRQLEYPFRVSNEDVLDDIKRYWDEATDVVGGYWNDTDEEMADEIGISKPTLAELLDDNRLGMTYANLGGNSGVATYDLGEDWILINFTTGARYLYTTKSTSIDNIEQMKRYAHEGKGLNSYIMRMVKTDYAGRNVNGNLVIKPGMEAYIYSLNKRLQLLYAFRNTAMPTISNEGFLESIKKFFGVSNKDIERDIVRGHTYNHAGFASIISKYFGNSQWLDKQTFVTGDIDPKGISNRVGVDRKADIFKTIEANDKFEPIRKKWDELLRDYRRKLKPLKEKYKDGPFNDATYEALTSFFEKNPPPKLPDSILPKAWYTGEVNGPIKALTKEEVKKAADLMSKSLKNIWDKYDNPGDRGEGYVVMDDYWVKLANSQSPNANKLDSKYSVQQWVELAKKLDGVWLFWSSKDFKQFQSDYRETLYACAKWIDRSIKGKQVVSSEHHTKKVTYMAKVSNNGIHDTLKRYQEQLATAGRDGLDPTARKIMSVGLEAIGISITVSNENFDDTGTIQTHHLQSLIDTHITKGNTTVSNESLWGAVKYLFGGNYEDLPKINAAYEESMDAVKSTYGNPQWVAKRRLQKGNIKVKGYLEIAKAPAKALERVKQNNAKALEQTKKVFKNEMEYLGRYIKFLSSSERSDNNKAKALLDMFDTTFDAQFGESDPIDWSKGGEVPALTAEQIVETAKVFEAAMHYRLETDQFYKSGFYKAVHTESGKPRYGEDGTETAKLEGAARDLAVAVGERIDGLQEDYYNSVMSDWANVNDVVKGCLMIMEESAR